MISFFFAFPHIPHTIFNHWTTGRFLSLYKHYQACHTWVKSNVERRISRLQFGRLIAVAWGNLQLFKTQHLALRRPEFIRLIRKTDLDFSIYDSSPDMENNNNATCTGCGEEYTETTRADDWIPCIHCRQWLREGCTKYQNTCEICKIAH
ncbi:hypothetical protein QE152_g19700 [Popillia japonica]|uniref:RING-type domain-containing protein n=1 Tax=Popillia japonica TaxID=7064 RepID=A0AAW1KPZ6_POPJA